MKHFEERLQHTSETLATYAKHVQHPDPLLQHPHETLATYL
jgi:hypothetical protein